MPKKDIKSRPKYFEMMNNKKTLTTTTKAIYGGISFIIQNTSIFLKFILGGGPKPTKLIKE